MMKKTGIYFDQAATSYPKPKSVVEAMVHFMSEVGVNVGRGSYREAYTADSVVYETRELLKTLFNASDSKNVIFTANITQSLNMVLKGYLKPGDHVLVSAMEHNAVMRPLIQLKANGVSFDRIPCTSEGELILESIEGLIKDNTKAIIMTHASNVCGTMMPIEEVGKLCEKHRLKFIVDAAQTAGVIDIDMKAMHIDVLTFTGHKSLLGPQGIGGFLLTDEMAISIEPYIAGGTGSFSHTEDMPSQMPDKFEAGTLNTPGVYGLNAALKYLMALGLNEIRNKEMALTQMFLEGLKRFPNVTVIGKQETFNRTAVVSIQIEGIDIAHVAYLLDKEYRIMTRVGLHCAPHAHKTLGTYPIGTLRFSFGHLNTPEEVQMCLEALATILNQ